MLFKGVLNMCVMTHCGYNMHYTSAKVILIVHVQDVMKM